MHGLPGYRVTGVHVEKDLPVRQGRSFFAKRFILRREKFLYVARRLFRFSGGDQKNPSYDAHV